MLSHVRVMPRLARTHLALVLVLFLTIDAVKVVTLFKIYVENSRTPVTSTAIEHTDNMDVWFDGALP